MTGEQKELVQKVMELILKIEAETTYCVMFDMSGHVNLIDISLRESKKKYESIKFSTNFYYSGDLFKKTKINSIIELFETLLDTGEFKGKNLKEETINVVVAQTTKPRHIYTL